MNHIKSKGKNALALTNIYKFTGILVFHHVQILMLSQKPWFMLMTLNTKMSTETKMLKYLQARILIEQELWSNNLVIRWMK